VGGLIYSLIGAQEAGSVKTLSEVLFTQESEISAGLLQRFYQQTFGQIYADAQPATLDLTEHYTKQLGLHVTKLRRRMRTLDPMLLTASTLPWGGLERALPNPLTLAIYKGRFRSFGEVETRTSLCHGDLHSRNILVDDENHFWLIDFARSTTSHILRDFAELESDIKFHVLPLQAQSDFVAFEQALTMPTTWEEEPTAILLPTRLQQAFDIITALRRTARELLLMRGAIDEYYQALFWHAIYIAQVKGIAPERKQQALISAALLCEKFGIL
jgi:thiamine kinase-like enzyme